jgi:predicted MPP superfamily phosphohydrolase
MENINAAMDALSELKRVYYLTNNGDLNQEGLTLYHSIGKILDENEKRIFAYAAQVQYEANKRIAELEIEMEYLKLR